MKLQKRLLFTAAAVLSCQLTRLMAGEPEADSAENSVIFDGAGKSEVKAPGVPPDKNDKARLIVELERRIYPGADMGPGEKSALDSMISKMLDSPTARETAAEFVKTDAKAQVFFKDTPGTVLMTINGQKKIWGILGYTQASDTPPTIVMNKFFLQYDKESEVVTFAHELLGHTLEAQRMPAHLKPFRDFAMNDEENAMLVGWLVSAEAGIEPADMVWSYIKNPDESVNALRSRFPYFVQRLTREEMKDPVPVYRKLLADTERQAGNLDSQVRQSEKWNKFIDHLVNAHEMERNSFKIIREDIKRQLARIPDTRKNLAEIEAVLRRVLARFSSDEGKEFMEGLAKASEDGYFKRRDARIKEFRERLAGLLLSGKFKMPDSFPHSPGQFTWEQLQELLKKEETSCPFGGL